MSDGSYCIIRPLGLVKGGKGLRHHENLLTLSLSGIASKFVQILRRIRKPLQHGRIGEVTLARVATLERKRS